MKKNGLKAKLAAGKPVYGAMVQFPDADLVEMLGYAGFDWILIDAEHGSINENDCLQMVRACELTDTTSIVRPPNSQPDTILRFLDRGAQGVQVPHVSTVESARAVVNAVRYPPFGKRGLMGATRAASYGFRESIPDFVKFSNEEILLCVMIEEQEAIRNLPEILKVEGIDVFFIGAGDLAAEMGYPGDKNAPLVQKAVAQAMQYIIGAGKVGGLSCDEKQIKEFVGAGMQYFHTTMTPLVKFAANHFWNLVGERRM